MLIFIPVSSKLAKHKLWGESGMKIVKNTGEMMYDNGTLKKVASAIIYCYGNDTLTVNVQNTKNQRLKESGKWHFKSIFKRLNNESYWKHWTRELKIISFCYNTILSYNSKRLESTMVVLKRITLSVDTANI